jgi:hypothetical protein
MPGPHRHLRVRCFVAWAGSWIRQCDPEGLERGVGRSGRDARFWVVLERRVVKEQRGLNETGTHLGGDSSAYVEKDS